MALRHCPDCGALRRGDHCPSCGWTHSRRRPRVRRDLGTHAWKQRSRRAREAHVDRHGLVCPGWPTRGHRPHPVPSIGHLALHELDGPGSPDHRCVVICRSINSSIGAPT